MALPPTNITTRPSTTSHDKEIPSSSSTSSGGDWRDGGSGYIVGIIVPDRRRGGRRDVLFVSTSTLAVVTEKVIYITTFVCQSHI